MFNKRVVLGICLILAPLTVPASAVTKFEISSAQASKIIDIAGRQRMLSQRMTKSACLTVADVNYTTNYSDMITAHNDFLRAHTGLRRGSVELGILPVTMEDAVAEMQIVDAHWRVVSPFIGQIASSGTISGNDLFALDHHSLILAATTGETVTTIAEGYAKNIADISLAQTITVDIAGRQRMLSQKMVKEMCMITVMGLAADDLEGTIKIFEASMNALISGSPEAGVLLPSAPVLAKLIEAENLWITLRPAAVAACEGDTPSPETLAEFSVKMEDFLRAMNEVVGLYAI